MKQLSGMDTSFLTMETPAQYGHVCSLVVVDPSTSGTDSVYEDLRRTVEDRLHLVEVYRRKLVEVPLGLDNPYWVDDPDLDLEFHIREIALPSPGDDLQLAEQVARIVSRPLDRTRPLWEWYVISGLDGGLVGILTKVHHSTIDGVSGVELLHTLLDTEPEGRSIDSPQKAWQPERTPGTVELLGRTALNYATRPVTVVRLVRNVAGMTGNPIIRRRIGTELSTRLPGGTEARRRVPRTPFNGPVTPHRRFAFCTLSLSDAQIVKRVFGVTVNDVVLALCSAALRRYLDSHGVLPEESLTAMVPVSVRTGSEDDVYSNRISGLTTPLHTDLADPVDRLHAIHQSMAEAKELQQAIPADVLTDITQFTPPALTARASRLMARMADRTNPIANVTISNVPGPRQTLYLAGSEMKHYFPVSTVIAGQGLNMTVQSYLDNLDFGFISCREMVPDVWDLCVYVADAMQELLVAADAESAG